MIIIQIVNTDITQLDVDCIFCPVYEDLRPAYEVGEAIFSTAGYAQLQKAALDADKELSTGFEVSPFQLKAKSLFLMKLRGNSEKHLAGWHRSSLIVASKKSQDETVAIPVLFDKDDAAQAETLWRPIFRFSQCLKGSEEATKTIFLVTRNDIICKVGQRLWPQMLMEEKDKMLKKQELTFNSMLAERNSEIRWLRQKNEELEQLLERRAQEQRELSAEDALLMEQLDRKKLAEFIELLCRVRKIPWEPMNETESGVWQLGYPRYPDGIFDIFRLMESDLQYSRNMDKIRKQKLRISELSLSQVQTYLTFLYRGERFCDGTIAEAVDDGRLLKLLLRIHDLINPYPW